MDCNNTICFFQEGSRRYKSFNELVKDLNFNTVLNYMALETREDISWISDVISFPLLEDEEIRKRQHLIQYLCENSRVIEDAYNLICQSYNKYVTLFDLVKKGKKNIENCGTTISSCIEIIHCLTEFVSLFGVFIEKYELDKKNEFSLLCNSFHKNEKSPFCSETASCIDAYKKKGEITLQVNVGEGSKVSKIFFKSVDKKIQKRDFGLFKKKNGDCKVYKEDYVCEAGMNFADYFLVNLVKENWTEFQKWEDSFYCLRRQSAFLYGCVKMYLRGLERGFYFCYPQLDTSDSKIVDLYELSLAFLSSTFPVSNDIELTDKKGVIVTGTNQGGKSTFLRSLGIAQVMFQSGMYVPATYYASKKYRQIFSHFTKREDSSMNTGRFEEELKRMEYIIQNVEEDSLIISNETFCGTTEVTAAKVAMSIVEGIKNFSINLWMVTHISQFAINLYNKDRSSYLFLSAAHTSEGQKHYKMIEKAPSNTSFGMELFQKVIDENVSSFV